MVECSGDEEGGGNNGDGAKKDCREKMGRATGKKNLIMAAVRRKKRT